MGVYLFTFFMGFGAVLQAALNRQMANSWGLASSVVLNNFVLLGTAAVFWIWVRNQPGLFSDYIRIKGNLSQCSPWFILPGLFGFSIVAGMPFVISKIGAAKAFIVLIVAQTLVSLLWDLFVEGIEFSMPRALGATLAVIGAAIAIYN